MKKFKEWYIKILANVILIIATLLMIGIIVLSIANKLGFRFVIKL